jgi:hypothetical protein
MRLLAGFLLALPTLFGSAQAPKSITPEELIAKAKRSIAGMKDPEEQGLLLTLLAKCQARHKDKKGAVQSLNSAEQFFGKIEEVYYRCGKLCHVAAIQAETGDISGAFDTAERIAQMPHQQAEDWKYRALCRIAVEQAKKGDFKAALANVDQIQGREQSTSQDYAWRDIANLQAKGRQRG